MSSKKNDLIIIMTTFSGRLFWTIDVINLIRKYTKGPYKLYIFDNGSEEHISSQVFEAYKNHNINTGTLENEYIIVDREGNSHDNYIICVRRKDNGLKDTASYEVIEKEKDHTYDYIVKVDTDTIILRENWDEDCINYMNKNKKVGVAGNLQMIEARHWSWLQGIDAHRIDVNRVDNYQKEKGYYPPHVQGGFMMFRKKAIIDCGFWNMKYPHSLIDVEISYAYLSKKWMLGQIEFVKSFDSDSKLEFDVKNTRNIYHPVRDKYLRSQMMEVARVRSHGWDTDS